jgi:hypothetical protein
VKFYRPAHAEEEQSMMLSAVKPYFDLHPQLCAGEAARCRKRGPNAAADAVDFAAPEAGWWWSLAQWGAMFAGVASRMWMDGAHMGPAKAAAAAITATLIFPAAYRKSMGGSEPHFLKLCVTFAAGHGYSAMLSSL